MKAFAELRAESLRARCPAARYRQSSKLPTRSPITGKFRAAVRGIERVATVSPSTDGTSISAVMRFAYNALRPQYESLSQFRAHVAFIF